MIPTFNQPFINRMAMKNKRKAKEAERTMYSLFITLTVLLLVACNIKIVASPIVSSPVIIDRLQVQTANKSVVTDTIINKSKSSKKEVEWATYEQMPTFPGGQSDLMVFLRKNTIYPNDAYEKGIEGRVIVSFLVMKDGSIDSIRVKKGVHPSLDKEALRVTSTMPRWIPMRRDGKVVDKVLFTIPVAFNLETTINKKSTSQKGMKPTTKRINSYYDPLTWMTEEKTAGFPGGEKAFIEFVNDNLIYPIDAYERGIEGKVIIQYIVRKNGALDKVVVIKSVYPSLDKEAERVASIMPLWNPNTAAGNPIEVHYNLVFNFNLRKTKLPVPFRPQ